MERKEATRKIHGYTTQGSDEFTTGRLEDSRYLERYVTQPDVVACA